MRIVLRLIMMTESKIEELKRTVLKFDSPDQVYLMLLIPRSKDNHIVQSQETMHTFVRTLKKVEDFDIAAEELKTIGNKMNLKYNLYVNVNPRSVMKAYYTLKKKFAEWDYHLVNGDQDSVRTIKKLDREWQTCLQMETSKSKCNYFLFDVDSKEKIHLDCFRAFLNQTNVKVKEEFIIETRNGYHLLVKPFNCKLFYDYIKDLKDAGIVRPIELLKDRLIQFYHSNEVGAFFG